MLPERTTECSAKCFADNTTEHESNSFAQCTSNYTAQFTAEYPTIRKPNESAVDSPVRPSFHATYSASNAAAKRPADNCPLIAACDGAYDAAKRTANSITFVAASDEAE